MNKKLTLVATLAALALVGAGCSSTADTNDAANTDNGDTAAETNVQGNVLDGAWEIVEATGFYAEGNIGTVYDFDKANRELATRRSPGGLAVTKGPVQEVTDDTIKVKFNELSTVSEYNYRFEGDQLILEPLNSDQVFTLERP